MDFRLSCKKFQNHELNFRAFGRKTQLFGKILQIFDKNSMENLIFIYFWENLLLKIETSEITVFFYTNFFRLGGNPLTPQRTPLPLLITPSHLSQILSW